MVFRLGSSLLSSRTLWVPFTVLLFAATFGRSEVSENVGKEDGGSDWENNANATLRRNLTGNPRIDYKTDPNLPRELNGYDLSDYPFFNKVPSNITFKCDGLKDGFYASVEHKCQLYHHCLFGTRYDFLCANYTAFDQRTFICQFVSDVDCPNSALFFHRNDELYVTKSTTTEAPAVYRGGRGRGRIRAQVALPSPKAQAAVESAAAGAAAAETSAGAAPISNKPAGKPAVAPIAEDDDYYDDYDYVRPRRPARRRRPYRKRRPVYTDYDDYDDYYDLPRRRARPRYNRRDDYDPDSEEDLPPRRLKKRKEKNRIKQEEVDYKDEEKPSKSSSKSSANTTTQKAETSSTPEPPPFDPETLVKTREELFSMSRVPPKIKPPVPLSERNKFFPGRAESTTTSTTAPPPPVTTSRPGRGRPISSSSSKSVESEHYDQYYDEEYDQQQQAPAKKSNKYLPFPTTPPTTTTTTKRTTSTTTTTTTQAPLYEYEYEEYEYDQAPSTTTTTTTTTTTPQVSSRRRNGRRQSPQESDVKPAAQEPSVQENNISTPKAKDTQIKEAPESNRRLPALRPSFMRRPMPTYFGKQTSPSPNTTPTRTTTTTPTSTPTTTTTERPTSRQQYNRGRVAASTEGQTALQDTTTLKSRGSRFWQRPTTYSPSTAGPTTTTTQAPEQVDYVYYDENVPLTRYGQRSATTYQQYSSVPDYVSDSPDPSPQPPPASETQTEESTSQEPEIYRPNPVTSRFPLPKAIEQTNYVTPFTSQSIIPAKTTAATYQLQFNHHPQAPQSRPEFISLLPEDEEDSSYYPTGGSDIGGSHSMISMVSTSNSNNNNNAQAQQQQQQQAQPQQYSPQSQVQQYSPQSQVQQYQQFQQQPLLAQPQQQPPPPPQQTSRFRNQITRMFAAPQELYPVYTTPPQYVKTVRARHVFPTMFLPFANY